MVECAEQNWSDIIESLQAMHCKNNIKSVMSKIGTCVYISLGIGGITEPIPEAITSAPQENCVFEAISVHEHEQ